MNHSIEAQAIHKISISTQGNILNVDGRTQITNHQIEMPFKKAPLLGNLDGDSHNLTVNEIVVGFATFVLALAVLRRITNGK